MFSIGNVHIVFFCPPEKRALGEQLIQDVQRRAVRMDGTITGEHGVGLSLRDTLVEEIGIPGVNMTRKVQPTHFARLPTTANGRNQIKFALDPLCILNCDKVIRI